MAVIAAHSRVYEESGRSGVTGSEQRDRAPADVDVERDIEEICTNVLCRCWATGSVLCMGCVRRKVVVVLLEV